MLYVLFYKTSNGLLMIRKELCLEKVTFTISVIFLETQLVLFFFDYKDILNSSMVFVFFIECLWCGPSEKFVYSIILIILLSLMPSAEISSFLINNYCIIILFYN